MPVDPAANERKPADPVLRELLDGVLTLYLAFFDNCGRSRTHPAVNRAAATWCLYLASLGYDLGLAAAASLGTHADRVLLMLKGPATSYAIRARFVVAHPDRAAGDGWPPLRDMLRSLDPLRAEERYARELAAPEALLAGEASGMDDVLGKLANGRVWISRNSLTSTPDENLATIVGALIDLLIASSEALRFDPSPARRLAQRLAARR